MNVCNTCKFYESRNITATREYDGICRFIAPRVVVVGASGPLTVWPKVSGGSDWCGQHKPKSSTDHAHVNIPAFNRP